MSFFNLTARAISQEAQYLSKERRLPRSDYDSRSQLIRSSEVDTFGPSTPGATGSRQTIHSASPTPPNAARSTDPQQPSIVYGAGCSFSSSSASTSTVDATATADAAANDESSKHKPPKEETPIDERAKGNPPEDEPFKNKHPNDDPLKEVYRAAFANLKREVRTLRNEALATIRNKHAAMRNEVLVERQQTRRARAELLLASRQLQRAKWRNRVLFAGMLAVMGFAALNIMVQERSEKEWKRVVGEPYDVGVFVDSDLGIRIRAARKAAAETYAAKMRDPSLDLSGMIKVAECEGKKAAKSERETRAESRRRRTAESEREMETGWRSWFWARPK